MDFLANESFSLFSIKLLRNAVRNALKYFCKGIRDV